VSIVIDCGTSGGAERNRGLTAATAAIRRGDLVVFPTETSYAVAADAFTPGALQRLRDAKGRGSDMALPVLVASPRMAQGIVTSLSEDAKTAMDAFWPGPLTLVALQQSTLSWFVAGESVSVRMPIHPLALALISRSGPVVAVTANMAGAPAPSTCEQARSQLGDAVAVYLDAGPRAAGQASNVIDVTVSPPALLRAGPFSVAALRTVIPHLDIAEADLPEDLSPSA